MIIEVGGRDPVGSFLHFIAARPIHVAHGHDLKRNAGFVGRIQDGSHPAAGSDHADAKGIVGTQDSGRGKGSHSTCNDEAAAIRRKWHGNPVNLFPTILPANEKPVLI